MPLFTYAFREMLRTMRSLEKQMRIAENVFSPNSPSLNFPKISLDINEDFFKRDSIIQDKHKFQLKIDVKDYKPEEISIKTVEGNAIQIEAKHEEKQDGGRAYISRQFVRKFVLPKGHDIKKAVSNLSADGVLIITAPKIMEVIAEKEIPIKNIKGNSDKARDKKKC